MKTICEGNDNYPGDYIDNLIRTRLGNISQFLSTDEPEPINITQRIDSGEERPLCTSTEETVTPSAAKNKDDTWLFIINNNKFRQAVRVERCR